MSLPIRAHPLEAVMLSPSALPTYVMAPETRCKIDMIDVPTEIRVKGEIISQGYRSIGSSCASDFDRSLGCNVGIHCGAVSRRLEGSTDSRGVFHGRNVAGSVQVQGIVIDE